MANDPSYRRQRIIRTEQQMVKAVEKYHDSPRAYEDKVTLVAHGFTLHLRAAVDIHAAENPHSQGEQYAKHILTAAGPGLEALAQTAAERLHDPTHLHEHESAMDALVGHVRANYYEAWVQPVVKVLNHLGIHV